MDLVRSGPDVIEDVGHDKRLWRRVYPPTGREVLPPVAFVFADTTMAKVTNVQVLKEAGRGFRAPRRESYHREAVTAKGYGQAVPVVSTPLEQLQDHGADAAVWRRRGRTGGRMLAAALDNPDGGNLYRDQTARAEAEEVRRTAAEREARRPVCRRCGQELLWTVCGLLGRVVLGPFRRRRPTGSASRAVPAFLGARL
ncbi:hypothetical protein AB0L74_16510 [Streptomyces sp. NPDC052020]|uniref:hypothetical protein n=1 Tax=Streptomyces sp. NPDC052020 TaxID=3155677 RepID=UPI003415B212